MSHPLRLTASLLALAFATAPASAATILIAFSGTGLDVSDTAGASGTAGVQGSILIDTDALPPNAGTGSEFAYISEDAPFFTTTLSFTGDGRPSFGGSFAIVNRLRGDFASNGLYAIDDERTVSLGESVALGLSYDFTPAAQTIDGFVLPVFAVDQQLNFRLDNNSNDFDPDPVDFRTISTTGSVRITAVTVSGAAAAVPEPATWGTMLLGFGLVGAAARRRRTMAQA